MASLEPKLFCGVALYGREGFNLRAWIRWNDLKSESRRSHLRHNTCQPVFRVPRPRNASTPTEPTGRCMFTFRRLSETADYTYGGGVCQATRQRTKGNLRSSRTLPVAPNYGEFTSVLSNDSTIETTIGADDGSKKGCSGCPSI